MLTELVTNDCDQLSGCLDATEQQYRQLEPGLFRGRFRRIDLPGVHVTEEFISHRIAVQAVIPDSCVTLFVPIRVNDRITLEGQDCLQDEGYIGQPGASAFLSLPAGFRSLSVELEVSALLDTAAAMEVNLSETAAVSRLPASRPTAAFRKELVRAFVAMIRISASMSELSAQQWSDRILRSFVNVLRETSGRHQSVDRTTVLKRRAAALNVGDYVSNHLADPLSLTRLCAVADTSERSLRNGFREVFGVSPNRFIKAQRLSAARFDLKRASADAESVTNIASRWGFAQLAHFATDYRAQFGERPSETLRTSF